MAPYFVLMFSAGEDIKEYLSVRTIDDMIILIEKSNSVVNDNEDRFRLSLTISILLKYAIIPIVDKHIDVLITKYERLGYIDEYGDYQDGRVITELNKYFRDKLKEPLAFYIDSNDAFIRDYLPSYTDNCHDIIEDLEGVKDLIDHIYIYIAEKSIKRLKLGIETDGVDSQSMTGHDYEHYIASRVNSETDWIAEVTQGSGDQGADVIISNQDLVAVVQVKYYSSNVGNKAVQEAYSAKTYYDADLAFVVTNSFFTKSAIALAEKNKVYLYQEGRFIEALQEY